MTRETINNHDLAEIELLCREELKHLRELRRDLLQGVPRSIDFERDEITYTPLEELPPDVLAEIRRRLRDIQPLGSILRKIAYEAQNFTRTEQQLPSGEEER